MHPKEKIEKVIGKPYYLQGVRIGCAEVSDDLMEFRELSLSNYLGCMYAVVFFPDFAGRGQLCPKKILFNFGKTRKIRAHVFVL